MEASIAKENDMALLVASVDRLRAEVAALTDKIRLVTASERSVDGHALVQSARDHLSSIGKVLKSLRVAVANMQQQRQHREASRFRADHVISLLRDQPIPTMSKAKRALARLAKFLDRRINMRVLNGETIEMEIEELAAVIKLVEMAEAA